MTLDDLIKQALALQATGHGSEPIFIWDGHSGIPYKWNGWVQAETVDLATSDGELTELEEGAPFVSLGFG